MVKVTTRSLICAIESVPTAQEAGQAPGQVWTGTVILAINYVLGATVLCTELISDQATNSILAEPISLCIRAS
jgi:hypothetical protein